ncbi:class I SAM-dependent methyltransferase [Kribbella endophytica]
MSVVGNAKSIAREVVDRSAVRLGFGHSEDRLVHDARSYWSQNTEKESWRGNSHYRDATVFPTDSAWESVGAEHLELFERLSKVTPFEKASRVVEWGCGGGSNAVAFAPGCEEFVGVDVNEASLTECGRQMTARTSTPFTAVLADLGRPEDVVEQVGQVDLFLCFYVLELVPSPEYGLRIMRIAHQLLAVGGLAFVQIKYDTGSWRTASRRRDYRESVAASMTTYPIDEFWIRMTELGLRPEACYLVPHNALDSRYAYYLLRRTE